MDLRRLFPFLVAVLGIVAARTRAQDTDEYFKQNCFSCHTIGGGRLVGPDLKDVETRRNRDWLVTFILDPQKTIDSGDPYAAQILKDARNIVMPKAAGIDKARALKLLDLIAAEAKLDRSRFAGVVLSDRPLTAADVARGRRLFTGEDRLKNGAPPCIGCHSAGELSGFGGGLLGPDLTDVMPRLQGRAPLGAWLAAPATPTMSPVFKANPIDADEILPLIAYFDDVAKKGAVPSEARLGLVVAGVIGAAAALFLFDYLWRRRFTGVRAGLKARARK